MATVNEDGTLQTQTTSGDSLTSSSSSNNSVVDSDTFLTLLIAEMQNQDPLEPTSNTEWVSQYATFTQVEQLSEMADSMDLLRANELVGKDVIMKVTSSSTGNVTYARGKVEYITVENDKPILVIDGNKYSLSDLDSVISDEYSEAYDIYSEFVANIDSLPDVKYADLSYADKITQLYEQYNFEMTDYQKNYMVTYASSEVDTLVNWVAAMNKLGVEFKTEEEEAATLDDVLLSFNNNMSSIMEKLDLLSTQVQASTNSGSGSSSSGTASNATTTTTTTTTTTPSTDTVTDTDTATTPDTDTVTDVTTTPDVEGDNDSEQAGTDNGEDGDGENNELTDEAIAKLTEDIDSTEDTSTDDVSTEDSDTEAVSEEI
jgi:flagellar basal-body rod modification protein FlgD